MLRDADTNAFIHEAAPDLREEFSLRLVRALLLIDHFSPDDLQYGRIELVQPLRTCNSVSMNKSIWPFINPSELLVQLRS
ncbi:hypothetical protein [Ornithinimicrobium sp. INDO-MA30-4]|uniref:hypothetical protein n=1 Tax=Ornithinimicrobium sp. INDO-MA30-4 TaxID=2908651 RepID=UPI001F2327B9|nr:hypothetical protein [Ornithinimicrobium sp. INDO-MA30-4]UJH70070.1 hypothetical protein L0A91_12815 [Ornithinimicrobium sp. INDO-MA30-4]